MTITGIGAATEAPAIPTARKPTGVFVEGGLLRFVCYVCVLTELVPLTDRGAGDVGEDIKALDRSHALCEVPQ